MLEKNICYNKLPIEYLTEVLKFEGGYVNHPLDNGHETNLGITSSTLLNAKQKGLVSYDTDIKKLTKEHARIIYEDMYYLRNKCNLVPHPLSFCLFDASVNNGRGAGGKFLQRTINSFLTDPNNQIKVDGGPGPKTIKGLELVLNKGIDVLTLCNIYNNLREQYYYAIVNNNPKQKCFLRGWLNRLSSVKKFVTKNI